MSVDQLLSGWVHARHGAGKSEDLRPALCGGITITAFDRIRYDAENVRHRPRHVVGSEPGALPERRDPEDRDSAERQGKGPGQSTGPAPPRESAGRYRAAHRASEDSWHGPEQNENRLGGFDLGVPVRLVMEFELIGAGSGRKNDGCGAAMLRRKGSPPPTAALPNSTRSFASLRTRPRREDVKDRLRRTFEFPDRT